MFIYETNPTCFYMLNPISIEFFLKFNKDDSYVRCFDRVDPCHWTRKHPATTPLRPRRSEDLTMRNSTLQWLLACMEYIYIYTQMAKLLTCLSFFADVTSLSKNSIFEG